MAWRRQVLAIAAGSVVAGCVDGGTDGTEDGGGTEAGTGTGTAPPTTDGATMTISSPEIDDGGAVPERFTADGADVSPPLSIDGVPEEARSLAVVVDDPDAPSGAFVHWLLWNLPPDHTEIPEDVPPEPTVDSLDAVQGTNDFGTVGYRGPAPPEDDDAHRYRFTASALDSVLDVDPGSERPAVQDAMDGHVLASDRLTATYDR